MAFIVLETQFTFRQITHNYTIFVLWTPLFPSGDFPKVCRSATRLGGSTRSDLTLETHLVVAGLKGNWLGNWYGLCVCVTMCVCYSTGNTCQTTIQTRSTGVYTC